MSALSKLAKHSAIYGLGSAISAIGTFALLPLFTQRLSTTEYGSLELINRLITILLIVILGGMRQGYIRHYYDSDNLQGKRALTGTILIFTVISGAALSLLLYCSRHWLLSPFLPPNQVENLTALALVWLQAEMLFNIGLVYLQINLRSLLYVSLNAAKLALYVSMGYWLLAVDNMGLEGAVVANACANIAGALVMVTLMASFSRFNASWTLLKKLIAFALPYLPAGIFSYILMNADRYFLGTIDSLSAVGLYSLAIKLGTVGTIFLMDPFSKVWSPFVYDNYKKENGAELIGTAYSLFGVISVTFGLGIALGSIIIIPLMSAEEFHQSIYLVPLVAIGSTIYSLACFSDAGILIAKKTKFKPVIFGIASLCAIAANAALVPFFGIWGAAAATPIAFLCLLICNFYFSNKYFKFPTHNSRLIMSMTAAVISYVAILPFVESLQSTYYNLGLTVISFSLYIALLFIFRVITKDNIQFVLSFRKPRATTAQAS